MTDQAANWADATADKVIKEKGDKENYVCAAGISPSGHIHIGNFREMITTAQIVKALKSKGKKVRFIYSWDDFDAFRKVPKDFPKSYEKYIGMPTCKVPDLKGCHKSYAEHFEKELEESIEPLNLGIEFIRQGEMFQKCKYAKLIKEALNSRNAAREILNKYRKEPLSEEWMPLEVFCEKCWKNRTNVLEYDGNYEIHYECECGHSNKIDFRKVGNVKLTWRLDWPMRWTYESVDFEPGGKDHSAAGGSYYTGKKIIKEIWNKDAPTYLGFEWISIKGGAQFSSSAGVVTLPKEVLDIYEPDVMTFLFSGTHPSRTFNISFDLDVLKIYEEFDRCERIYFGKEDVPDKEKKNMKRLYELSCVKIPKKMGDQTTFRHLTTLVQIHDGNIKEAVKNIDSERVQTRAECSFNWIKEHAPEDFKFKVHETITVEVLEHLTPEQKNSLIALRDLISKKKYDDLTLFNEFYSICEAQGINNIDFFKGAYLAIIGKKKGPRLANFILSLGQERVVKLLDGIK
tara:strand:- start:1923 stop:3467 length:1545 start_codon:yes stop_codon:yes gene_type:complete